MCGSCVAQCMQNAIEVRMMRQDLTVSEKPWPDPEKKHLARPVIRQKTDLAHLCVGLRLLRQGLPQRRHSSRTQPRSAHSGDRPRERPHPPRRTHQPEHAAHPRRHRGGPHQPDDRPRPRLRTSHLRHARSAGPRAALPRPRHRTSGARRQAREDRSHPARELDLSAHLQRHVHRRALHPRLGSHRHGRPPTSTRNADCPCA